MALDVIMYDRPQGKLVADFRKMSEESSRYLLMPSDEFRNWAAQNISQKISFRMVDVDPSLVQNGFKELLLRQRRFEHYATTQGRSDIETPQGVKRLQVSFENELDAIHFKMRWCG